jgi:hypothetical protein
MFATIINATNINANKIPLTQNCVTIKLFGLSTPILAIDIVLFFIGLVVTFMLAEMLANYLSESIEEAIKQKKYPRNGVSSLTRNSVSSPRNSVSSLTRNGVSSPRNSPRISDSSPRIIQCDKCYNEYSEVEIKKTKIFGHIFHQYCSHCLKQSNMRKSQSDSKFNYTLMNN